jgi:hypothetical protein
MLGILLRVISLEHHDEQVIIRGIGDNLDTEKKNFPIFELTLEIPKQLRAPFQIEYALGFRMRLFKIPLSQSSSCPTM